MNARDRKEIEKYIEQLNGIANAIRDMSESEQDKYDNLSEGLQGSEMGERLSYNADTLEMIADEIDSQSEELEELINE